MSEAFLLAIAAWSWPHWIMISFYAITLWNHGYNHGKPKNENYNIGIALFGTLISVTLLTWGGFY